MIGSMTCIIRLSVCCSICICTYTSWTALKCDLYHKDKLMMFPHFYNHFVFLCLKIECSSSEFPQLVIKIYSFIHSVDFYIVLCDAIIIIIII